MKKDIGTLARQLTLKEVQRLLREKQKQAGKLKALEERRNRLVAQLAKLEKEIGVLASGLGEEAVKAPSGRARRKVGGKKRGRKRKTAREFVLQLLASGNEVRLAEIVERVARRKGRTKPTPSDRTAVGNLLSKEPGVTRVGRGIYKLAKAGEAQPRKARGRKKTKK